MSAFSRIAGAGDLDELTSLIASAERTASELARLEVDRRRLNALFDRAFTEFSRELDAGHLPFAKLAELTILDRNLSKVEAELAAALAPLAEVLS